MEQKIQAITQQEIDERIAAGGGKGFWLDLRDPREEAWLRDSMGGMNLQEEYPLFNAAWERSREGKEQTGDDRNTVLVDYMIYSLQKQTLSIHVLGFFGNYVTGVGNIKLQLQDGTIIRTESFPIRNQKYVSQLISWEHFDLSPYQQKTLEAQFVPAIINREGGLEAGIFEYVTPACELTDTIVQSIHVTDPIHKEKETDPVRIILAKRVGEMEKENGIYDYDYRDVDTVLHEKYSDLFLDFSGEAVFGDKSKVFKGFKPASCDLWMYDDNGYVGYNMNQYEDFFRNCFTRSKDGFTWNLDYVAPKPGESARKRKLINVDWQEIMPMGLYNSNVNFYFHGHFIYGKEGDPSSDQEGCFLLSTDLPASETYKKKMPVLGFYWGCLGADTWITMEDGSRKQITQIRPGERVSTPDGGCVSVTDIITGFEAEPMYSIRVNGQKGYTHMTRSHLLRTGRGLMPAAYLRADDAVWFEDGSYRRVEELFLTEGGDIYNLQLEEPGEVLANGMASGDFGLQNTFHYEPRKPEAPEGLVEEAEKLAARRNKKGDSDGTL